MPASDTLLIASVLCGSAEQTVAEVDEALRGGADLVELRVDGVEHAEDVVNAVFDAFPPDRMVITCRSEREGGADRTSAEERARWLRELIGPRACRVDFEYADWVQSPRAAEMLAHLLEPAAGAFDPRRLILSAHDFSGRMDDLPGLVRAMVSAARSPMVKVAWAADDACDNLAAFDLLRHTQEPVVAIAMGPAGLPSRVLCRKFGAFASYCAARAEALAAPGQVSLDDMVNLYRFKSITPQTQIFGVIGDPVGHSQSPRVHNTWFSQQGINGVYVPFLVGAREGLLDEFLQGCLERPWLDVGGFSVTVPHKQAAATFVGQQIEPLAARIGAVNTLTPTDGGYFGHNTDYAGALDALTAALNCDRLDLAGVRVEVLGAGGVARAVLAGLCDCRARVSIANRSGDRAAVLAREFGGAAVGWAERAADPEIEMLINCTSVGMWPAVEHSPVPRERLQPAMVVFDTVYNPVQTQLLQDASAAGCRTVDGLSMFVHQAAAQFRIWTDQAPDVGAARALLLAHLGN